MWAILKFGETAKGTVDYMQVNDNISLTAERWTNRQFELDNANQRSQFMIKE